MKSAKRILDGLLLTVAMLLAMRSSAATDGETAFATAVKYTVKIETTVRLAVGANDEQGLFSGAGFVIDAKRGWILTNAHVTARSPATIRVRTHNSTWFPAKRIYVDPYLDLALIAVPRDKLAGMSEAALACDGLPAIGHPVGAYGHPWGLDFTGTRGVVAGVSDRFELGALLTDAPINDGNSGGPLISLVTGKVVGINTSAIEARGAQNLNFAVAAHYACKILDLLRAGRDPSPPEATLAFFADAEDTGILKVARNFTPPGHLALQPGDVIKAVVGEPGSITRESEFIHALRGRLDQVSLRIERGGKELVLSGSLPAVDKILSRRIVFASGAVFGQAHRFDASEVKLGKVATCQIESGSLAQSAGFKQFDAIETIDGEPIRNLDQVYRLLDRSRAAGKPINVVAKRVAGLQAKTFFTYHEIALPVEELHWIPIEE